MSIKVVILDISNTTIKPDSSIQPGIVEFLSFCREKNLKIAFVTNELRYKNLLLKLDIDHDIVVTRHNVKIRKPSPQFIYYIENKLKISRDKFIYIGDRDRTDAFCAAHAKVLYFCATWANENPAYGIPVSKPQILIRIIKHYLLKKDFWYWKIETTDQRDRNLRIYALLNCASHIRRYAVDALKRGVLLYRDFFLFQLISSTYLSGLIKEIYCWSCYPASTAGISTNQTLERLFNKFTKEVKVKHFPLFIRHTEARDSGLSRSRGESVDFANQIDTVHLNPEYMGRIRNKNILILDDFTTGGYSFECARNLLYQAGASNVICVAIGKYGHGHNQVTVNTEFNPYAPVNSSELTIEEIGVLDAEINNNVTGVLEESLEGMIGSRRS